MAVAINLVERSSLSLKRRGVAVADSAIVKSRANHWRRVSVGYLVFQCCEK